MQNENLKRIEMCPQFDKCSANSCPLEAEERAYIPGEDVCPFTIKKRKKSQKGLITHAPNSVLEVILESNLKMLNPRNQKRWRTLHQRSNLSAN